MVCLGFRGKGQGVGVRVRVCLGFWGKGKGVFSGKGKGVRV